MRGGTSRSIFFNLGDLPERAQEPGPWRDVFLQRVAGSPDPYQKQIDGMGGATSSTSKVVIISLVKSRTTILIIFSDKSLLTKSLSTGAATAGNLSAAVGQFWC